MKKFIIANWKCNPGSLAQAKELFNSVRQGIVGIKGLASEIVICPPFVFLPELLSDFSKRKVEISNIKFGAQNCFYQPGAFTGEVSINMLKDLGAEYVIVGHSERRQNFGETDEMVNKKIKAALEAELKVILCVGETQKQRQVGKTDDILLEQLEVGLAGIPLKNALILVAYEPVWAIGTGDNCEPQDAGKARLLIQEEIGENAPILYGGSVNVKNARSYIDVGYNGVLIGGVSLKAEEFVKIVKNSCK